MTLANYHLVQTCHAYPERYDVMLGGHEVGVIRFRSGEIVAEYGDEIVYRAYPAEDFDDGHMGEIVAEERNHFLNEAVAAIDFRHFNVPTPPPVVVPNAEPQGWTVKRLDEE